MSAEYSDIWRAVGNRLEFFTKETRALIPEASGFYAWFVPLWIYDDDLRRLLERVNSLLLYDAKNKGAPKRQVAVRFAWDELEVRLHKKPRLEIPSAERDSWDNAMGDRDTKAAIQHALMEASIFMPPLYVGKTNNLRARYFQHVDGVGDPEANTFHRRFSEYVGTIGLPLEVSDLIFASIRTPTELTTVFRDQRLNELLEHILMRLSHPAFSVR